MIQQKSYDPLITFSFKILNFFLFLLNINMIKTNFVSKHILFKKFYYAIHLKILNMFLKF